MNTKMAASEATTVEARARLSLGISSIAIYEMVASSLSNRKIQGGTLVDVGCGQGHLWNHIGQRFSNYIGVDAVRYSDLPSAVDFRRYDLEMNEIPLPKGMADVVVAVETIEHLENPRAFFRELVRIVKPGGWVIVTTPNQRSILSLLTLVVKGQFNAFQDANYPAHITALLEVDLIRIAEETGLGEVETEFSRNGRIVFTKYHYPAFVARFLQRLCSDNLLLIGRKLAQAPVV